MDAHAEISRAIDNYRDKVVALSHDIHEHPELKFEEHFASDLLSKAATELGLEVERKVGGLKTAFRAEFGGKGPTVAILAEYDALPNGHSCGHNLIAGAALGAVAGLKSIAGKSARANCFSRHAGRGRRRRENYPDRKGALRGVDAAMMAHPTDAEFCTMPALATQHLQAHVSWTCRTCCAGAVGWLERAGGGDPDFSERRCDAVASARRLADPRNHHRRRPGGEYHPGADRVLFLARAKTSKYAKEIGARVLRCAEAAAMATGTQLEHIIDGGYKNMINNLSDRASLRGALRDARHNIARSAARHADRQHRHGRRQPRDAVDSSVVRDLETRRGQLPRRRVRRAYRFDARL